MRTKFYQFKDSGPPFTLINNLWMTTIDASGFDLSKLNGNNGFVLDCGGYSVSQAGDINGDKIDDFITGPSTGNTICVVFGMPNLGKSGYLKSSNLNGTNGFIIAGSDEYYSGYAVVSAAGDINHDGIVDLIIGARYASPNSRMYAGSSFVIFGSSNNNKGHLYLSASTLNGKNGFAINGIKNHDAIGYSVSGLGDINADGFDDLIIGAPQVSPGNRSQAGSSYVVFGDPKLGLSGTFELSTLDGSNGFVINGIAADDQSGSAVRGIGDFNGDGIADFAIGAGHASSKKSPSHNFGGCTYVIFGRSGLGASGTLELQSLNGENGFVINGANGDLSGSSIASGGDLNDDGKPDLIIGANHASEWSPIVGRLKAAKSYVVFGKSDIGINGSLELSALNGSNGFVIHGATDDESGGWSNDGIVGITPVSIVGDINGDGIDDAMIGVRRASPGERTHAGSTFIIYGGAGLGSDGTFELTHLNGKNGFSFNGALANEQSGHAISGLGDVNNDGATDLIIGALFGPTYVIFGGGNSSSLFSTVPPNNRPLVHPILNSKNKENNSLGHALNGSSPSPLPPIIPPTPNLPPDSNSNYLLYLGLFVGAYILIALYRHYSSSCSKNNNEHPELLESPKINYLTFDEETEFNFSNKKLLSIPPALIKTIPSLIILNLSRNQLDDTAMQSLADCLELNPSLQQLNLAFNRITEYGLKELLRVIANHSTLKILDLSHNFVYVPSENSEDKFKELVVKQITKASEEKKGEEEKLKINITHNYLSKNCAPLLKAQGIFHSQPHRADQKEVISSQSLLSEHKINYNDHIVYLLRKNGKNKGDDSEHVMIIIEGVHENGQKFIRMYDFRPDPQSDQGLGKVGEKEYEPYRLAEGVEGYHYIGYKTKRLNVERLEGNIATDKTKNLYYKKLFTGVSVAVSSARVYNCLTWAISKLNESIMSPKDKISEPAFLPIPSFYLRRQQIFVSKEQPISSFN